MGERMSNQSGNMVAEAIQERIAMLHKFNIGDEVLINVLYKCDYKSDLTTKIEHKAVIAKVEIQESGVYYKLKIMKESGFVEFVMTYQEEKKLTAVPLPEPIIDYNDSEEWTDGQLLDEVLGILNIADMNLMMKNLREYKEKANG